MGLTWERVERRSVLWRALFSAYTAAINDALSDYDTRDADVLREALRQALAALDVLPIDGGKTEDAEADTMLPTLPRLWLVHREAPPPDLAQPEA